MLSACVPVRDVASVTLTVKLLVPVAVGVPEMTPVLDDSPSPAGRLPKAMDHVYGLVPPVAASVALYGEFCTALGNEVVVIVMLEEEEEVDVFTVMLRACVAV